MANAAMRALRAAQSKVNVGNEEPEINMDLGDNDVDLPRMRRRKNKVKRPRRRSRSERPQMRKMGESILYDDDFNLDQSSLMDVLANEEVANVHSQVQSSNDELEKEVTRLKASVKLVGKEMKTYKTQYEAAKTSKDNVEKSNTLLKAELKKVREDMTLRTAEMEAVKKSTEDLRAEK
ncbi:hypothetical protein SESBI_43433 [Sesbania bispinosa]|nr:hypothetical protein SESBI_43433 [Sesbania bispinosa]